MKEEDIKEMHSMQWYHKIELRKRILRKGIVTPGQDHDDIWIPLKKEMKKVDFAGKKVLDIGCWDGLWSFEAEKLGAAEVIATDINSQRSFSEQGRDTFEFARKHLNSKVKYKEVSVYELDSYFKNEFDIVIFFGVLYHLRYPQLGIGKIRKTLKERGTLLMETAVVLDTDDTIIQTDYRKIYSQDRSTWNAFSIPALTSLLHESYLKVIKCNSFSKKDIEKKIGRAFARCEAFSGRNEHHYFPDLVLGEYFEKVD